MMARKQNPNRSSDPVQAAFDEVRRLSRKIVKVTAELESDLREDNAEKLGRLTLTLKQKREELAEAHKVWFETVLVSQAQEYRSARDELRKLRSGVPEQEVEVRRLDAELAAIAEEIAAERNLLLHVQSDRRGIVWDVPRQAVEEVAAEHQRTIQRLSDSKAKLEAERTAVDEELKRRRARAGVIESELKIMVASWKESIGDLRGSPADIRAELGNPSCLVDRGGAEKILGAWENGLRLAGKPAVYRVHNGTILFNKETGVVVRSWVETAIAPSQATAGTPHPSCVSFDVAALKRELQRGANAAVTA